MHWKEEVGGVGGGGGGGGGCELGGWGWWGGVWGCVWCGVFGTCMYLFYVCVDVVCWYRVICFLSLFSSTA